MVICHCNRVTTDDIGRVLRAGARTEHQVARATLAGTGCGSCLPEVRALCERVVDGCAVCIEESLVG